MLPMARATATTSTMPAQTPIQGGTCLACISIMVA